MQPADIRAAGADLIQPSYSTLKNCDERRRACLYFLNGIDTISSDGPDEERAWQLRAALMSFRSIFDVLNTDLKSLGYKKDWDNSEFKHQLDTDPLIRPLYRIRDFAVHTADCISHERERAITVFVRKQPIDLKRHQLYINPISDADWRRNVLGLHDDFRIWFNRQCDQVPATWLVREAIHRSSAPLAAFITTHRSAA
jgi:hypothetical protein